MCVHVCSRISLFFSFPHYYCFYLIGHYGTTAPPQRFKSFWNRIIITRLRQNLTTFSQISSGFIHCSTTQTARGRTPSTGSCYVSEMSLTSAGAKAQRSPRLLATLRPSELGRSRMTALAPWLTSLSTVAFPSPEAPPVTSPTMPWKTWKGTGVMHVTQTATWNVEAKQYSTVRNKVTQNTSLLISWKKINARQTYDLTFTQCCHVHEMSWDLTVNDLLNLISAFTA